MATNKQISKDMKLKGIITTSRQISKSRKRGWIWVNNGGKYEKVKYTAPNK